jgi:DNA-binding MarR family transcriptional regulator
VSSTSTGPNLALALLKASDWFNDALLRRLHANGWPTVTRSHSLVFANLDPAGTRPAELARRLGITRQSMQKLLQAMVELDLVEVSVDDRDARATVVHLTAAGKVLMKSARRELALLERELARRIGMQNVDALRSVLALSWGDPPYL